MFTYIIRYCAIKVLSISSLRVSMLVFIYFSMSKNSWCEWNSLFRFIQLTYEFVPRIWPSVHKQWITLHAHRSWTRVRFFSTLLPTNYLITICLYVYLQAKGVVWRPVADVCNYSSPFLFSSSRCCNPYTYLKHWHVVYIHERIRFYWPLQNAPCKDILHTAPSFF